MIKKVTFLVAIVVLMTCVIGCNNNKNQEQLKDTPTDASLTLNDLSVEELQLVLPDFGVVDIYRSKYSYYNTFVAYHPYGYVESTNETYVDPSQPKTRNIELFGKEYVLSYDNTTEYNLSSRIKYQIISKMVW